MASPTRLLLLFAVGLTLGSAKVASTTTRASPNAPTCPPLEEARTVLPVPLPPEVEEGSCDPVALYLLWRLEREIGMRADPPSRAPGHPDHPFFRYVEGHRTAFEYDETSGSFIPSELRSEALRRLDPSSPFLAEMAYTRIVELDRAAWEDGDGRGAGPRLLERYRAFVDRHGSSSFAGPARERIDALTRSFDAPLPPPPSSGLLPGQTPLDALGGLALLLVRHDSLTDDLLRHLATETVPSLGARASHFHYEDPGGWPRGRAVALWREASDRVAENFWIHLHPGDFPPHALHWLDLDGDGASDLFYTAGYDDVEETRVFLNRMEVEGAPPFVRAIEETADYLGVVDLDDDGRPELLDPGDPDFGSETPVWFDGCALPDRAAAEAWVRFGDLAEGWEELNRYETLHPLRRVRVLRLERSAAPPWYEVVDVTRRFPDHLRWRLGLLEEVEGADRECREMIEGLRAWIRSRLGG